MSYTKVPKVSYSAKSTFDWCPRQYRYIYIDKVIPDKPVYQSTVVGSGIHALVHHMYKEENFTLLFLREHWSQHLISAIQQYKFPTTPKVVAAMWKLGRKIIDKFYYMADREGILVPPIKTEWRFKLLFDDLALSGVVDLIVQVHGQVYILDLKTGLTGLSDEAVNQNEQLTFYALAALKLLGIDTVKVGFFYPQLGTIKYSTRSRNDYDKLITDTRTMLKKIAERQFVPTYTNCNWCRFSTRCAAEDTAVKTNLDISWFYVEPRR